MARVTVVNDNPDFLDLMADLLAEEHFETSVVDADAVEPIPAIRATNPDVLVIDLRMGSDGLHGWEVAKQVRADPGLSHVPVLVCSADHDALESIGSHLAEVQRVSLLAKPFSVDEFLAAVGSLAASEPLDVPVG